MDDHSPRLICPATQPVLRDEWYVVAFAHEVDDRQPLLRYCCGDRIALFRTVQGAPVALGDRCPHRGSPLSLGKIVEDTLQCPYHGFRYGVSGRCLRVPSQTTIVPELGVRSYPVIDKGGFVWLWAGAAELADPALLPDCHAFGLDREGWYAKPYLMLEIKSNYSLLFENLLDTSHISFLHGTALDGGRMASSTFHLESAGKTVRLVRELKADTPTPGNTKQYGLRGVTTFDRRLESIAYLPNLHIIRNTFTFPDHPGHPPHVRINVMPITPSRPNELYQFLTMTASYPETHPAELVEGMRSVLDEDRVVLEAIQGLYDESGPDLPEWSVNADVAGLRARRKLAELAALA
ncbi:MAG TPA: aromatic ring-hydroxylating dioxygenase subunit alpha [Stellaceae bacterium]|jgi:vanillate O-demethylase monooxygenase subunit